MIRISCCWRVVILVGFLAILLMGPASMCLGLHVLVDHEQVRVEGDTVRARVVFQNTDRNWAYPERPGEVPEKSAFTYTVRSHFGRELATGRGEFDLKPDDTMPIEISFPKADWPAYRLEVETTESGKPITMWRYIYTDGLGEGINNDTSLIRGHHLWQWMSLDKNWEKAFRLGGQTHLPGPEDEWSEGRAFSSGNAVDDPHHIWTRHRFRVPAEFEGRRLILLFQRVHYKAEVYFNGHKLGEHTGAYESFRFDVTGLVKFEDENELLVLVTDLTAMMKDYVYGTKFKGSGDAGGADKWLTCDYSDRDSNGGITGAVLLLAVPEVRIDNVVVRPSVSDKKLTLIATLTNDTNEPMRVTLNNQVLDSGKEALPLFWAGFTLPAGGVRTIEISRDWKDPKLWWPKSPHLYQLRTWLDLSDGTRTDLFDVRFGFREFTTRGKHFLLNDEVFKPGFMDELWYFAHQPTWSLPEVIWHIQSRNARIVRLGGAYLFGARKSDVQFDVADETGLLLVSEAFDASGFVTMRNFAFSDDRFWENCRGFYKQFVEQTINHPSVVIYSLANEMFRCGGGRIHPRAVPGFVELAAYVRGLDPTRPIMFAGDGDPAGEDDDRIQIIDLHYPYPIVDAKGFPGSFGFLQSEDAVKKTRTYPREFRWTGKKPITMTETEYTGNMNVPGGFAMLGGDRIYTSSQAWNEALEFGMIHAYRIYRDAEVAFICPWSMKPEKVIEQALGPVSVFIRDLTHNFYSGAEITRALQIHHDVGMEGTETLMLRWRLSDGDGNNTLTGGERSLTLKPGELRYETLSMKMPSVQKARRLLLELTIGRPGEQKPLHTEQQWLKVWPRKTIQIPEGLKIVLFDPAGRTAQALAAIGLEVPTIEDPNSVELARYDLLILGEHALLSGNLISPNYIRDGGRMIIMQQPYGVAPHGASSTIAAAGKWFACDVGDTDLPATLAFISAPGNPVFEGLTDEDFRFWQGDGIRYTALAGNVLEKPVHGSFVPLLQSGQNLRHCVLMEMSTGKGKALLAQLMLTATLGVEPAADHLFQNMLKWAATPSRPPRAVVLLDGPEHNLNPALSRLGIAFKELTDEPVSAEALADAGVVIVSADSPAIPQARELLGRFVQDGGRIWLCGLTPENRPALGNLLPEDLEIRKREPGQLIKAGADPLVAGISNDDLMWVGVDYGNLGNCDDVGSNQAMIKYELVPQQGTGLLTTPGGLMRIPSGKGFILVDQIRWQEAGPEIPRQKADMIASLLATNLDIREREE